MCGALAGALTVSAAGALMLEVVDSGGKLLRDGSGDPVARARQVHGALLGSAIGGGIRMGIVLLLLPVVIWVFVFPRRGYPKRG